MNNILLLLRASQHERCKMMSLSLTPRPRTLFASPAVGRPTIMAMRTSTRISQVTNGDRLCSLPATSPSPSTTSPTAAASPQASSPPRHRTSGVDLPPPRDPSQPLVLYEGPAQYRPLVSYFLTISFSFIGIMAGYNIREHAVWPILPSSGTQELVDWKWRYLLGAATTCVGFMTGGLFKWVASK